MASPETGAQRMPQQLCPADMKALANPGTGPIMGRPSDGQGRMQAW
eukprot:CAMPEP_0194674440 /NCGR_PEP_ID=MMETSP0295-20121207/7656_1 /TAXON_ID=39354 /ORGANISM="Heterosigma akashiwo, Strain CCMP2393" /LENGTH=45 /DNA_ID= /DNA_START= /DNA_END= /DNA_ORIENTATION=